ncbi:MAG: hypothetical protein HQL32_16715, partial [Planctomycetes bacterium]|nr:hypothetical protein [Planctomycetota bacterium]
MTSSISSLGLCLFSLLLFSELSQAQDESFAELRAKGLHKKYTSALAESSRMSLKEQKKSEKDLFAIKEKWLLQLSLLGMQPEKPQLPEVEEIPFEAQSKWAENYNYIEVDDWKSLPKTQDWEPKWGLSYRQRRSLKSESSKQTEVYALHIAEKQSHEQKRVRDI